MDGNGGKDYSFNIQDILTLQDYPLLYPVVLLLQHQYGKFTIHLHWIQKLESDHINVHGIWMKTESRNQDIDDLLFDHLSDQEPDIMIKWKMLDGKNYQFQS